MDILNDEQAKAAIVSKRWRMWYKNSSMSIYNWKVQKNVVRNMEKNWKFLFKGRSVTS